jgi:hypothetical protein
MHLGAINLGLGATVRGCWIVGVSAPDRLFHSGLQYRWNSR